MGERSNSVGSHGSRTFLSPCQRCIPPNENCIEVISDVPAGRGERGGRAESSALPRIASSASDNRARPRTGLSTSLRPREPERRGSAELNRERLRPLVSVCGERLRWAYCSSALLRPLRYTFSTASGLPPARPGLEPFLSSLSFRNDCTLRPGAWSSSLDVVVEENRHDAGVVDIARRHLWHTGRVSENRSGPALLSSAVITLQLLDAMLDRVLEVHSTTLPRLMTSVHRNLWFPTVPFA